MSRLLEYSRDQPFRLGDITFKELPYKMQMSVEPGIIESLRNMSRALQYKIVMVSGGSWKTMVGNNIYRGRYDLPAPGQPDLLHQLYVTYEDTVDYFKSNSGHVQSTHQHSLFSRWEHLGSAVQDSDEAGSDILLFKAAYDQKLSVFPGIGPNPYSSKEAPRILYPQKL